MLAIASALGAIDLRYAAPPLFRMRRIGVVEKALTSKVFTVIPAKAGMTNKAERAVGTGPRACPTSCSVRDEQQEAGRAQSNFPKMEARRPCGPASPAGFIRRITKSGLLGQPLINRNRL